MGELRVGSGFSKETVGELDSEGKIYRGTGVFGGDLIGYVDNDGKVYKGSGVCVVLTSGTKWNNLS